MSELRRRLLESPTKPAGELTLAECDGLIVYFRRWTLADRMNAQALSENKDMPAAVRTAKLVQLCLCDADGKPVFPEGDGGAIMLPGDVADRIIESALAANGIGEQKKTNLPTTTN